MDSILFQNSWQEFQLTMLMRGVLDVREDGGPLKRNEESATVSAKPAKKAISCAVSSFRCLGRSSCLLHLVVTKVP